MLLFSFFPWFSSSLSDLSDRSEEKAGLRQISRVFEANSWLFNEKMRET